LDRDLSFPLARQSTTELPNMNKLFAFLLVTQLVSSASAQFLTVSGGGTINLGQSANIVASPTTGVATAYSLIENGVVVQTVGTFGIGGSSTDVGKPHTFTVTPSAAGTYVYSAQVALNVFRGHLDYLPSDNSVTLTVAAPVNHAPTISWNAPPGAVASGQSYTVSAHGHDADGNLTQVNVWKNGQPFSFAGGGDGTDGDSANTTTDTGPQTVTYTAQAVDSNGATSAIISQTLMISAPNQAPTVSWSTTPGAVSSGQSYTVTAHGHDPDGNLIQVNVWKNGQPFALGGGGNGTDADSGNSTTDTGPQTVTFTAQAVDSAGATSALITQVITIAAPPPVQYNLTTVAGAGGSVSPGGVFLSGATATVTATPDAFHDFAGWSGDAGGIANPYGIVMDRDKNVQASFVLKIFPLTTSAGSGGSVTPGGLYPLGSIVTIAATADATHYFSGWTGDASGATPSVAVTIDRAKSVQAQFAAMAAQTITFAAPGDHPAGAPAFALVATASSGLPVTFTVLSGPASVTGNLIQVAGPGAVTVQATQPGDAFTLAAPPVTQSFNVTTALTLKYRAPARTLLQSSQNPAAVPYLIQP
jgi:hypothetical protein